jgi:hypothetical protein
VGILAPFSETRKPALGAGFTRATISRLDFRNSTRDAGVSGSERDAFLRHYRAREFPPNRVKTPNPALAIVRACPRQFALSHVAL